jgi:hypothetical protein
MRLFRPAEVPEDGINSFFRVTDLSTLQFDFSPWQRWNLEAQPP